MAVGYASRLEKMSRIFVIFPHENLFTVRVNINAHKLHRILLASVDYTFKSP